MLRRSQLLSSISFIVMVISGAGLLYSAEPLNEAEMTKATETIKRQYESHVYIVNAWSKIISVSSSSPLSEKTVRWRKRVGTAMPMDECGYLITPMCVVQKAEKVTVVKRSGDEVPAEIVGTDPSWQIAVLKIAESSPHEPLPIASRSSITTGKQVILLGMPQENTMRARAGVISNVRDSDGSLVVSVDGKPGMTGAPVFSTGGSLLGILTHHLGNRSLPDGDGDEINRSYLVIPMDFTSIVAREIITRINGSRGWLGVKVNLSQQMPGERGIVVQSIYDNSPATRIGLRPNDCIIEYNGMPIDTINQMCEAVSQTIPGNKISLKIIRNDKELLLHATLVAPPQ
ncbi:S1C family serine protease [Candidatus Latescibacterota bacterium]